MHQIATPVSRELTPKQKLSLDQIKELMPVYIETYLADRIAYQSPGSYTLHCPFHGEDANPSCSANNNRGTWLFNCFACGTAGSIIDLHAGLHGFEPMSRENLSSLSLALDVKLVSGNTASPARKNKRRANTTSRSDQLTENVWNDLEAHLQPYHNMVGSWRADLLKSSPYRGKDLDKFTPHCMMHGLYKPDDLLWMGDVGDSGMQHHAANFRTQAEWLQFEKLPPRLAAGTFKTGSISRSKNSVLTAPYIVLESDELIGFKPVAAEDRELNRCLSYGLIHYVQEQLCLTLRTVVDTSNKSLHAWFDHPDENDMAALLDMAKGLRLDIPVLKNGSSSPLRTPGCFHEGAQLPASLMYLNPKY